jgi:predicted MPP superfamily phosphohydrolase
LVHFLLDVTLFVLVFAAQWRMARMLLRAVARSRFASAVFPVRILLGAVLWLLTAGYVLGFTEVRAYLPFTSPLVGIFSGVAELWLLTSASGYALYLLFRVATRRVAPFDPSRRRLLNAAGGTLFASPFLIAGYGALIERTRFRVREIDVEIPGLHPDLEGLRLLQLTDIHLSPFLSARELERVIHAANETRPHLALVTGDLISARGDPLDDCLRLLATLKTDAGILGCLGNHEHYSGAENYATELGGRLGIRFLRRENTAMRFGDARINLAGVDYERMSATHTGYLRGAERMIVPGALNVLMSHNPDVFPTAAAQGYDLTLAGHTHGGQVNIEILTREINPAHFFTPYVYGRYQWAGGGRCASAYVSRGIGTIGIPARVGAPPEIAMLHLRKA